MANLNQIGYEDLTVADTAIALASVPTNGARWALIHVETGSIRWRADGTNPTASVGQFVAAGAYIDWTEPGHAYNSIIAKAAFIRTGATSATLRVSYFN